MGSASTFSKVHPNFLRSVFLSWALFPKSSRYRSEILPNEPDAQFYFSIERSDKVSESTILFSQWIKRKELNTKPYLFGKNGF